MWGLGLPEPFVKVSSALFNDRFCFFHSAATLADRGRARRAGGIARSRVAAVLPGDTQNLRLHHASDICALLAESINQVRRGQLDPIAKHFQNVAGCDCEPHHCGTSSQPGVLRGNCNASRTMQSQNSNFHCGTLSSQFSGESAGKLFGHVTKVTRRRPHHREPQTQVERRFSYKDRRKSSRACWSAGAKSFNLRTTLFASDRRDLCC